MIKIEPGRGFLFTSFEMFGDSFLGMLKSTGWALPSPHLWMWQICFLKNKYLAMEQFPLLSLLASYVSYVFSGFLLVCFFGHILHVGYVFNFWKCPETYLRHLKTVNIYFGDEKQFAASHFILFIPCHENLEFLFMAEVLSDVSWPDTPSPRPGPPNFKNTAEEMVFISPYYLDLPLMLKWIKT